MFDLDALEAAGFRKTLTTEEWELLQEQVAERYSRAAGPTVQDHAPGGNIVVDYVLERDNVRVSTEQNTQDQAPFGISMTVRYPTVAVIESLNDTRRVCCDASDTSLILALADELATPLGYREETPRNERGSDGGNPARPR